MTQESRRGAADRSAVASDQEAFARNGHLPAHAAHSSLDVVAWDRPGEGTPRPQAMLFTLWGDYIVHHGGGIWAGSLIRIASEFGLSELALRSVLSRMGKSGWLESTRLGNRSYYRLTRRGYAVIEEGTSRIFRPDREPWDGDWQLVTYSVPEAQREVRDQFRKRLSYLGFGPLSAGAWIAPHNLTAEVHELAEELGIPGCVFQFRGAYLQPGDARALAARVWPLEQLAATYQHFVDRWRRIAEDVAGGVTDARAFVLRFWLIHEYQRFFLEDPDLPPVLVPADWPGAEAQRLFESLHNELAPAANHFFDAVYEAPPDGALPSGSASRRTKDG